MPFLLLLGPAQHLKPRATDQPDDQGVVFFGILKRHGEKANAANHRNRPTSRVPLNEPKPGEVGREGARNMTLRAPAGGSDNAPMPITVQPDEVEITAIRAQGVGGQHVNKVSTAIHLRFNVPTSSLPEPVKARLLALRDHRITDGGDIVIKAQAHRSQDMNRADALARLQAMVDSVEKAPLVRRPTKPTYGSKQRRLEGKSVRSAIKLGRGKVDV